MQTLHASFLKLLGHRNRIVGIDGFLGIVAFRQAHAFPFDDVNSRYQFNHKLRKLLMICSPTLPLFSGWN